MVRDVLRALGATAQPRMEARTPHERHAKSRPASSSAASRRRCAWPTSGSIAFDMDSTLINIECVDEIADAAGKKAEVAAITEAAMRGEIADYKESLRRRVALLRGRAGVGAAAVYDERLRSTRAPSSWSRACKAAGLKTLLVSGGFTFFTDRVRDRLRHRLHALATCSRSQDGALTGRMVDQPWGDICDGAEKRRMLLETCAALGIAPAQADRRRRRRQRPADDGRGRPVGGLPRQAEGARAGDGGDRRRRPRPPARGRAAPCSTRDRAALPRRASLRRRADRPAPDCRFALARSVERARDRRRPQPCDARDRAAIEAAEPVRACSDPSARRWRSPCCSKRGPCGSRCLPSKRAASASIALGRQPSQWTRAAAQRAG